MGSARETAIRMGALCSECPLNGSEPVLGHGPSDAKLAVVGEAPGREEQRTGRPFTGWSGEILDAWLSKRGYSRARTWVDNAAACFPPGGDLDLFVSRSRKEWKESGKDIADWKHPVDCCRARLFRALRIPKCKSCGHYQTGPAALICGCKNPLWIYPTGGEGPASVVPVGNYALESLSGLTGITKHRGSPYNMVERAGRKGL